MKKIMLCELNVSEGRDEAKIEEMRRALSETDGIAVIEINSDADHNRSVFSWIGSPEAVLEGAKNTSRKAIELIDMSAHHGSHPRMGAVDVAPFVPIRGVVLDEALDVAREYGKFLGELGVPVFYYEEAATRPDRKNLADIRKGQYEALPEKMKDEAWRPDEGPFEFVPKSGATVTGVRFPLIAFNVNLRTNDLSVGKEIAKRMRFSSGGLRYCRAIALELKEKGMIQVSMNLTNYEKTSIPLAFDLVKSLADNYGVGIAESELVGPIPLASLEEVVRHCLRVRSFTAEQVIENHLLEDGA
ncbi:MAG: glutamate formimidoyltransferase [Synergistaceae bacterium]|jgi:glutamate formiminotransferase|nr:glutamate formimidoyltransferase [Synergistaceae bacterium]